MTNVLTGCHDSYMNTTEPTVRMRVRLPSGVAFPDREATGTLVSYEQPPGDALLAVVLIDGEKFPARVPADSIEAL